MSSVQQPEKRRCRRLCSSSRSLKEKPKRRSDSSCSTSLEDVHQSQNFESLPPEVLEMVFRFLSYRDIAGPVRLISKKCCSVATSILNGAFQTGEHRLLRVMKHLQTVTHLTSNVCELVIHGRAHNYLEFIQGQYKMLRAVVWRYTHPPRRQKFGRLCFYGGQILDELDALLRRAKSCPGELLDRDGGPACCITSFGGLCKRFMNYFEKVSESRVNSKSTFVSGCKPVDVLDCLLNGRELLHYRVSTGRAGRGSIVSMRLRYVMERAWFTCLEVPSQETDKEDSWRDQQRFMYLRLRRLVGSVNEHHLERVHYERELLMQTSDFLPPPKPPTLSTYSGYGEYAGRFFYYGNMNEYAFDSKVMDTWRRNAMRDRMRKRLPEEKPCYDLVIDVELRCSPELAPLAVRSMLKCDDFENTTYVNSHRPELFLRLNISCPASVSNKLPGNFIWELRSPRRHKLD